eukprot:SM000398S15214  [mRNA]  locus=s398:44710:47662:- [translate_table: standard]
MSRAAPALCRDFQRGRCWPLPPPHLQLAQQGEVERWQTAPLPPSLQSGGSRRPSGSRYDVLAPAASSRSPSAPVSRDHRCGNPSLCKQQINEDEINEKPTWWRLTCYAHWKELPNDVVGDVSSEELRAEAYSAARQGVPLADLVHRERTMFRAKETIFEQLRRSPYTGPAKPLGAGPPFPPLGDGGMDPFPKSPTNVQGPMLFGQPVTNQRWSAFGVPRAAPFGSTFGPQAGPISSGPPPVVGIPQGDLFGSFSSSSLPSSGSSFPADLTTSGQLGGSPLLFGREGIAGHHGTSTSAFSNFGRLIATTPEAMQPMQSPHELHSASSGGVVELTPASSAISLDAGSGDVWRADKWMLGQVRQSESLRCPRSPRTSHHHQQELENRRVTAIRSAIVFHSQRLACRRSICNTIISQGLGARARRGSGLSTIMTVSQAIALVAEEGSKASMVGPESGPTKLLGFDLAAPLESSV